MKKKIIVLLALIILSASSLFAEMNFFRAGATGGWTKINSSPTMGLDIKYAYATEINTHFFMGVGSTFDFDILFTDKRSDYAFSLVAGPEFAIPLNRRNIINILVGPAFYSYFDSNQKGASRREYDGLGAGIDLSYTYYLDEAATFGLTAGASCNLLFADLSNNSSFNDFQVSADGFIAFSWKLGDYINNEVPLNTYNYHGYTYYY